MTCCYALILTSENCGARFKIYIEQCKQQYHCAVSKSEFKNY